MKPIAAWLLASRKSQTMPDGDGLPWTQEHFLKELKAAVGWAPWRTTYSTYETGKATPEPATLAKFVAFWGRYGIEPPDLNPQAPAAPKDPLQDLVDELRAWRLEDRRRIEELEGAVRRLSQAALVGPRNAGRGMPPAPPMSGQ